MAVQINLQSFAGEAASPEVFKTNDYANAAAAVAAISAGFLVVNLPPSPQTAPGGPPAVENMAISVSQIKSIVSL